MSRFVFILIILLLIPYTRDILLRLLRRLLGLTGVNQNRQTPRMEQRSGHYYDLLEVSPTASTEVIKAAYRQLALKHHPDRQETPEARAQAEKRMQAINEAYEVLSDEERRATYDRQVGLR